jgi:hypothetical protein
MAFQPLELPAARPNTDPYYLIQVWRKSRTVGR